MDKKKTSFGAKKKSTKSFLKETTKTRLIVGVIIAIFALSTIGYFTFTLGIPATVLTGATICGQDVKVVEMNYRFREVLNMYKQYGMISSDEDLDKVFNEQTGQTYRDYIMDQSAQNLQRTKILFAESQKAGFVAENAPIRVDQYIANLRKFADEKNTTVEKVLRSQYGVGSSLRAVEGYLIEEYTAEEYSEYLKQTQLNMTTDEMQALYDAEPTAYETVTYNAYLFASKVPADETDAALIKAGKEDAKKRADSIIVQAKDPATFLAACKDSDAANNATGFADGKDPTIYVDIDKSYAAAISEDFSAYLFDASRKANDTAVIETPAGYYAVLFQSRRLDTTQTVTYRMLTAEGTDKAALKTEIDGYKSQVTDEASFISLTKKFSDDKTAYTGGYYAGVTQDQISTDSATDLEKQLYAWLFSADRKPGDMLVLENIDSTSLYYFSKTLPKWQSDLNGESVNKKFEDWYKELAAKPEYAYSLNLQNIKFATY